MSPLASCQEADAPSVGVGGSGLRGLAGKRTFSDTLGDSNGRLIQRKAEQAIRRVASVEPQLEARSSRGRWPLFSSPSGPPANAPGGEAWRNGRCWRSTKIRNLPKRNGPPTRPHAGSPVMCGGPLGRRSTNWPPPRSSPAIRSFGACSTSTGELGLSLIDEETSATPAEQARIRCIVASADSRRRDGSDPPHGERDHATGRQAPDRRRVAR
jgi:hypothetical protein